MGLNGNRVPPTRLRGAVAAAIAGVAAAIYYRYNAGDPYPSDFDQLWYGARAVLAGIDPYAAVGPEGATYFPFPLFYPLPALLVVAPLTLLPVDIAGTLFVAVSVALMVWGLTRDGWIGVTAVLSGAFLFAVRLGQWTPLFLASWFLPALGVLAAVKPHEGLIVAAGATDRRYLGWALGAGSVLLALAFSLQPTWMADWSRALTSAPKPVIVHLFTVPGVLLGLALLRWRRADAWLLLGLAAIPHTSLLYTTLLLFAIPRSRSQMLSLTVLSNIAWFILWDQWSDIAATRPVDADGAWHIAAHASWATRFAPWETVLLYLPCLWMVLRRPNEGPGPAWLSWIQRMRARFSSPPGLRVGSGRSNVEVETRM